MKRLSIFFLFMVLTASLSAQDDLMNMLSDSTAKEINYATATFKSTRVINGHSVQMMAPGQLDVRISHRFGRINSGAYEFFGLDQSNMHFSLEYGITKWLMVGIGRGSYEKTFDGFAKYTILRQSSGGRNMPVSVSALTSIAATSLKWADPTRTNYFSSRLSYVGQVMIARKFSPSFSLQLTPTIVHRNLVATETDPNDIYAVGAGGRMKLTRRISLNAEYFYMINSKKYMSETIYNPISLGFDIETGGHVFTLLFTNSLQMIEKGFVGETTGNFLRGDIHFGFNISRVFTLKQ
jgi:hypothetical protein